MKKENRKRLFQLTSGHPRFLGISTAVLAIITAIFKELHVRNKMGGRAYAVSLTFLFIFVTVTGYLGGEMTFGLFRLLP